MSLKILRLISPERKAIHHEKLIAQEKFDVKNYNGDVSISKSVIVEMVLEIPKAVLKV